MAGVRKTQKVEKQEVDSALGCIRTRLVFVWGHGETLQNICRGLLSNSAENGPWFRTVGPQHKSD